MADDDKPTRRALVMAGGCAIAAGVVIPALVFVAAPVSARGTTGGRWVKTVKLDDLKEGEAKRVAIVADRRDAWTLEKNVELGSAWLVRKGNVVHAFSAVCPHLGCSVNAVPASGFACPCHTSNFDAQGKRTGGPSPRDMDEMATRVEDGVVSVDFRRYRIGVAEKIEA